MSKQGKPNICLSECLLCTSSTLQESDVAEVGAYPVYGANGIVGYLDTYNTTSEAIYIIKDGSGVGAVSCVKGKCSATGTLNILQTKEGFSLRYLYFILKVFSFEPTKQEWLFHTSISRTMEKPKSIVHPTNFNVNMQICFLKLSKRQQLNRRYWITCVVKSNTCFAKCLYEHSKPY